MADDVRPTEDPLAWEARNGRRAAFAAGLAAVCGLAGSIVTALLNGQGPAAESNVVTVGDALTNAAAGRPQPQGHSATVLIYQGNHAIAFTIGGLLIAIAAVAADPPMAYLYGAAHPRGRVPRGALILAAGGAGRGRVRLAGSPTGAAPA